MIEKIDAITEKIRSFAKIFRYVSAVASHIASGFADIPKYEETQGNTRAQNGPSASRKVESIEHHALKND